MNMKYFLLLLLQLGAYLQLKSQEVAPSQYYNNPFMINPAAAGYIAGTSAVRLSSLVRSQWTLSQLNAYQTEMLSVDGRRCLRRNKSLAAGAIIQHEHTRLGGWRKLYLQAAIAYHHSFNEEVNASLGFRAGWLQLSINPDALQFDEQFSPIFGYQAGLSNGENFANLSNGVADMHTGLLVYNRRRAWMFGIALQHVNQPGYSFFENTDNRPDNQLDVGITAHGTLALAGVEQIRRNKAFKFAFLFRKQSLSVHGGNLPEQKSQQWQLNAGLSSPKMLGFNTNASLRFAGRSPRFIHTDALILGANFTLNTLQAGISYDLNLSRIASANKHGGTFEFSLTLLMGDKRDCIDCPQAN